MAAINFTVVPETYQDDYRVVFDNPHVPANVPVVLFAFLYAILFTVARFVLDRVLFYPLADLLLGTSPKAESKHLESGHAEWRRLLNQGSRPTQQQIADAAASSSSDPVRVADWLKKASNFKKSPKVRVKFADSAWRFCCYSFSSVFAIVVLFPKAWFWDTTSYWNTVPNPIDPEVHFYYMYGIGFYSHLIIAQFYEERKKDFWQMFFHHLVTICLFLFSYLLGFTRVGVAILFLHDLSDPFLEFAKIWNYCKLKSISEVFFALFALVFAVSRLYYFPRYIIYSTWVETGVMAGPFHGAYRFWRMFNLLLLCLLALHIFWFSIILKMAIKLLFFNEFKGDARSDLDSEDDGASKKKK